jgi:predicted nucleic acid-binding Zn ribbon protein
MHVKCGVCGKDFEARRSTAKYCSARCRQRQRQRQRRSAVAPRGLIKTVTAELKAAGKLDSFDGQLAVELARQLTQGASGIPSLSKELRAVMASALGDVSPAQQSVVEDDDEVAKARSARERKAREAAG